jgi:hypothetical protein
MSGPSLRPRALLRIMKTDSLGPAELGAVPHSCGLLTATFIRNTIAICRMYGSHLTLVPGE